MILKLFVSFIYLCHYIELLCQWSDDKNGMYHIWYVPQKAGAVMMLVRLNSQPILGGGFFQIAVSEAAAPVVEVSPSFSGESFFFFHLIFRSDLPVCRCAACAGLRVLDAAVGRDPRAPRV